MATNYPSSLDTSTTLPAEGASIPLSTNHVTAHQNLQDAVEAIEAKLGVDSSAVTTSHDYKLSLVTSTDKSLPRDAAATTTNKILGTGTAITLGSDAEGDMYYRTSGNVLARLPRGTDNYIMKMNGNVPNWEAENVTVDASTTVKGIVEAATSSEVTAGTATGGTGAVLAVTPDALAASTPVFNGSGLTNLTAVKLLSTVTTDVTITNSNTETTVASYSVPANTFGASGGVRVKAYISDLDALTTETFTVKLKYGASTVNTINFTVGGSNISNFNGYIDFTLLNTGSTSSQNGAYFATLGNSPSIATTSQGMTSYCGQGTSSIDSTSTQTLSLTFQWSTQSASESVTFSLVTIEKLN